MDDKAYLLQIENCMEEIKSLADKKRAIDRRMASLERLVKANAEMLADSQKDKVLLALDEAVPPTGFTEAIRYALRKAGAKGMTPTEIREALVAAGVSLTQNNPMAAIHTVLKRLEESGQVKPVVRKRIIAAPDGSTEYSAYQWAGGSLLQAIRAVRRKPSFYGR